MEFITVEKHTFELIDHVPLGYSIWNIGKNMPDGYLPFCRLKAIQPFNWCREIELDTLKAMKVDKAQVILAAIGGGQNTIEKMEEFVRKNRNAKPNTYAYRQVQKINLALPVMRSLNWY